MRFGARPLRSVMYVPGNKEDWMRKAPQYGADALILDLDDSVAEENKSEARLLVRKMVEELGASGQTLFVRVNRLDTGLSGDDLEAVTCSNLYGVILPKVECPEDVFEVDVLLKFFERRVGVDTGKTFIDPSLETAQGIRRAYEIATASPRVAHMGASWGKGGDVARSVGFEWTAEGTETLFLRSKVLVDSRAAGVPYPLTGGWMDIHDPEGLRKAARHVKQLGYTGMHLIHPSHVPIVNEVFTPTREEVAHWQGLIEAMEERRSQGGAAVTYQGSMVDIAHEEAAHAMLRMAQELGVLDSSDTQ
ncbi:MAG: CoA ester lyase [Dehalococcoidia bacterium]|nr:CoA ester lyase [Dehalococcoidia bacterium]